jgi:ribosomal protein S18 acetylase RimI-like enzyme
LPQSGLQVVELRKVEPDALVALLAEETAEWDTELDWDFSHSAEQLKMFAQSRSLAGVALVDRGQVAGYAYTVIDEPKAVIGDVYLRPGWRGADSGMRLFKIMLDAVSAAPGVMRVESQLMLVAPEEARVVQGDRFVRLFERRLLARTAETAIGPADRPFGNRFRLESWDSSRRREIAALIVRSYQGHVDGQINDQFTTQAGAEAFLHSLLDNGGCGALFRPGSLFACDPASGELVGMVMTSFVARDTGHIVQLCVTPEAQGAGLGRELLRQALYSAGERGARQVSLTVTSSNRGALQLYESFGFQERRRFCAFVWEAHKHVSHSS